MSSFLKAYYLQQMGIETWVRRTVLPRVSGVHMMTPKDADSALLVVFEGGELDKASQWIAGSVGCLLKHMLLSIGLSPKYTPLIFGDTSAIDAVLQAHVAYLKPRVVLVFRQTSSAHDEIWSGLHSTQFIHIIHPMDLLSQPLRKKSAYTDLLRIKRILCADQLVMS